MGMVWMKPIMGKAVELDCNHNLRIEQTIGLRLEEVDKNK